ncbi:MAG: hypothetical protein JST70_02370 [Bacteroidetes bacterium]|nr:hypothetical protein [Bacteroidota bacterium]
MKTDKKTSKTITKKKTEKLAIKEGLTFDDLLRISVSPPAQKTKKSA